ncbi:hypothetical protein AAMO2058_001689300, partial [Amorphochlora amoebiformis]
MRGFVLAGVISILLFRVNAQTYEVTCRAIARSAIHFDFWLEGQQNDFRGFSSQPLWHLRAYYGSERVYTFSFDINAGSTNTLILMVYDQHYSSCPNTERLRVPKYQTCSSRPTGPAYNGFRMSCNSVEPNWNEVITTVDQSVNSVWRSTSHNIWPHTAGGSYTSPGRWRWQSTTDRPNSWGTTSSRRFDPAPASFSMSTSNFDDWDTPQISTTNLPACVLCDNAQAIWGQAADETKNSHFFKVTVNSTPPVTSGTGVGDLVDCHLTVDDILINIYVNGLLKVPYEGKDFQGSWTTVKKFSFYVPTEDVRVAVTAWNIPNGPDACLQAEFFLKCDTPNTQNDRWRALKQDSLGWLVSGVSAFTGRDPNIDPFFNGNWASQ